MNFKYLVDFDLEAIPISQSDVLIVGAGIAGLTVAVTVADSLKVQVLAKSTTKQTSTWRAQGGIAVSLAPYDSPELHYKDTMAAGGGICDPVAVKVLVEEAAESVSMLLELGTEFDKTGDRLQFGREGGHSVSRVIHAGDSTGATVAASLVKAASGYENITLEADTFVLDLLEQEGKCFGVLVYDYASDGLKAYFAPAVVLAAGGMGQIYDVTTNPVVATGDGLAMAERRQVKQGGLEFVQFHPTALNVKENPRFLISEAVRGEGAFLVDKAGRRFMPDKHPLAELAPRDIVSRAVVETMHADHADHVYLDARHISADRLKQRFPSIWKYCQEVGFDISKDLVPVGPAAHYLIGGIVTDLQGQTSLDGLYASGEVASTGVHGANRLASNSLLEGLVFSRRLGALLLDKIKPKSEINLKKSVKVELNRPRGGSLREERESLRKMMGAKAGALRTVEGLEEAAKILQDTSHFLDYEYDNPLDWETVNMITLAKLIVSGALERQDSLGVHVVGN